MQTLNKAEITVSLVTWNSANDLPMFLNSLADQTYKNFKLIVSDNNSTDNSVDYIKKNCLNAEIIRNKRNLGFAAGHNQVIKISSSPYVLIANCDIVLDKNYLLSLIETAGQHIDGGSFGGKLLKMDKKNIIDSVGIMGKKSRQFIDRGEGETDSGQYDLLEQVFGISGALALYRREALFDVQLPAGDFFDEDYFMYKEDVDLAWRLQKRGWKSIYQPKSLAWHRRSTVRNAKLSDLNTIKTRKQKSESVRYLSYRNHCYTLIKNERLISLMRHLPWILCFEAKKMLYILFMELSSLKGFVDLIKNKIKMLKKRRFILSRQVADEKEILKWFI